MRRILFFLFVITSIYSCNQNKSDSKEPEKKTAKFKYTISKEGIDDLKIGMNQGELEKLLNMKFQFKTDKDAPGYWEDTVRTKYKDIDVALYFFRESVDDDSTYMQLMGIETKSDQVGTATGIGVGDTKHDVIPVYEENPINMGPEWEAVNDTTWDMSKTKYSINVKDDKWDKQLIFHLVDKKIVSLGASVIMED
jgi:hypothetical protein